jgi:co-chaperonin GroES (HSP10)
MGLRPAAGHLLVLPIPDAPPKGGIILAPKTVRALSPYIRAVVIARGKGTPKHPMNEFRNNESNGKEIVLFSRGLGTILKDGNIAYRIIHVSEIVGFWDNAENGERER